MHKKGPCANLPDYEETMNMVAKNLSPALVNEQDDLAFLNRRLGELDSQRLAITKRIITTEKTVGAASDFLKADMAQAEALLAGKPFVPSHEKPVSILTMLHAERNIIDAALKIGRARQHALVTERAVGIWASYSSEIAEIEKDRVQLAFQLQSVNRARERLREKISKAGGIGNLCSDGVDLLGLGDVQDDVQWAAARLIADNICSRREIEKVSNG
jgi:hypothetical protein